MIYIRIVINIVDVYIEIVYNSHRVFVRNYHVTCSQW